MANLVDFSQIIKASILVDSTAKECARHPSEDSKKLIKHFILNSLRSNHVLHKAKYGNMVLACDSKSWRKEIFPQYKWKRQEAKEKDDSGINWDFVYEAVNELLLEIQQYLPFLVIKVPGAEGDDIIAVLTELLSTQDTDSVETDIFGDREVEPILITSSDRDNFQLHAYKNVKQFSPMDKKLIRPAVSPRAALIEKIVKGDPGDGIPGLLCSDDHFKNPPVKRIVMSAKKKESLITAIDNNSIIDMIEYTNYKRNLNLISYEYIPNDIKDAIINEYSLRIKSVSKDKMKLMKYFADNGMRNLYSAITDFY